MIVVGWMTFGRVAHTCSLDAGHDYSRILGGLLYVICIFS